MSVSGFTHWSSSTKTHFSSRAFETWYSNCVYSTATRVTCFARLLLSLWWYLQSFCKMILVELLSYTSSCGGIPGELTPVKSLSCSGDVIISRDSNRVRDSDILRRRCKSAWKYDVWENTSSEKNIYCETFSSRSVARWSSFSCIAACMACNSFLESLTFFQSTSIHKPALTTNVPLSDPVSQPEVLAFSSASSPHFEDLCLG